MPATAKPKAATATKAAKAKKKKPEVKAEVVEHAAVKAEIAEHVAAAKARKPGHRPGTMRACYLRAMAAAAGHRQVASGVSTVQQALLRGFLGEAIARAALCAFNRGATTICAADVLDGQADAARHAGDTASRVYG